MQYTLQLNSCAPLLPVNLTVNVSRFSNSVRYFWIFEAYRSFVKTRS